MHPRAVIPMMACPDLGKSATVQDHHWEWEAPQLHDWSCKPHQTGTHFHLIHNKGLWSTSCVIYGVMWVHIHTVTPMTNFWKVIQKHGSPLDRKGTTTSWLRLPITSDWIPLPFDTYTRAQLLVQHMVMWEHPHTVNHIIVGPNYRKSAKILCSPLGRKGITTSWLRLLTASDWTQLFFDTYKRDLVNGMCKWWIWACGCIITLLPKIGRPRFWNTSQNLVSLLHRIGTTTSWLRL